MKEVPKPSREPPHAAFWRQWHPNFDHVHYTHWTRVRQRVREQHAAAASASSSRSTARRGSYDHDGDAGSVLSDASVSSAMYRISSRSTFAGAVDASHIRDPAALMRSRSQHTTTGAGGGGDGASATGADNSTGSAAAAIASAATTTTTNGSGSTEAAAGSGAIAADVLDEQSLARLPPQERAHVVGAVLGDRSTESGPSSAEEFASLSHLTYEERLPVPLPMPSMQLRDALKAAPPGAFDGPTATASAGGLVPPPLPLPEGDWERTSEQPRTNASAHTAPASAVVHSFPSVLAASASTPSVES